MVAFVTSWVVFLAGVAVVVRTMRVRPVGAPVTWGEATLAATFTFGMMMLGYAIVPNQWLQWADNELNWRADSIAYNIEFFGRGKITVTKQVIRDFVVLAIYGFMLGLNVVLWSMWQKRGKRKADAAAIQPSPFGRPLVRKV